MPDPHPIYSLLQKEPTLVFPGFYDALGAKLVERAGFPLTFISGHSVAATQLGLPDFGDLTQTEMVAVAKRICGSVNIPVIIDADTGYGNALKVIRTVNELLNAGAAGMVLEDQVWPKRCGHMKGKRVISVKNRSRRSRRQSTPEGDRDFFIVARTDVRQVRGLDNAIQRCHLLKKLEPTPYLLRRPKSKEELAPPLVAYVLEGGVTPLLEKQDLESLGFQLAVCPLTALYASAKAMQDMFDVIKTRGTTRHTLDRLLPFEDFHKIIQLKEHYALDDRYQAVDPSE